MLNEILKRSFGIGIREPVLILPSGKRFYTNFPKNGSKFGGEDVLTLDDFVEGLKSRGYGVEVKPNPIYPDCHKNPDEVAVYVER